MLRLDRGSLGRRDMLDIFGEFHKSNQPGVDQANAARLYSRFMEFPSIIESINEQLFSVAAKKICLNERKSRARALEAELLQVQEGLKQVCQHPSTYVCSLTSAGQPR